MALDKHNEQYST
jgi:hypothetical protein